MSYTNVTRGQASFVSRTAKRDVQHPGGTTTFVKRVTGEIFEPTGSNVSTAFMLVSGSTEMHKEALMSASLVDGGAIDGKGLIVGEMNTIALSYVSASTHVQLDLFR
jgi:hypothetical protein|tara:strand:+ start:224 stop:544 length:321 start_codon:yes stop_codon:yes gene_type:complete